MAGTAAASTSEAGASQARVARRSASAKVERVAGVGDRHRQRRRSAAAARLAERGSCQAPSTRSRVAAIRARARAAPVEAAEAERASRRLRGHPEPGADRDPSRCQRDRARPQRTVGSLNLAGHPPSVFRLGGHAGARSGSRPAHRRRLPAARPARGAEPARRRRRGRSRPRSERRTRSSSALIWRSSSAARSRIRATSARARSSSRSSVEHGLDPGEVEALLGGHPLDPPQPLDVLVGVQAGVLRRALRGDQPARLVHAQRLRVHLGELGGDRDHEHAAAAVEPCRGRGARLGCRGSAHR